MTPAEQDITLATLRRHTDETGIAAARAFRDAAAAGDDLGRVSGGIADEAIECNDIRILRPLVEALVMHHVRHSSPEALAAVLSNPHFQLYTSSAIEQMISDGLDVEPAMALIQDGRARGIDVCRIFVRYIRRYPQRMRATVEKMRPTLIPSVIRDLVMWEHVDVSPVLGMLTPLLDNDDVRARRDAALMYQMAEGADLDLSEARDALLRHLDDPDEDVRQRLANSLARHSLRLGDAISARLETWPDPIVRGGALRALSGGVFRGDPVEGVSRLARALLDEDGGVRTLAAELLERARLDGRPWQADDRTLRDLAAGDCDAYLYRCALADPRAARVLADALERPGLLPQAVHEIVQGTHLPPCDLCDRLPRTSHYSDDGQLPAAFAQLVATPPHHVCPLCGQRYVYARTEEWDDMTLYVSIDLDRLAPADEEELARCRVRLRSPLRHWREEAAWALTRDALRRRDAAVVRDLLGSSDHAAVLETARVIAEEGTMPALEGALLPHLDDADETLRTHVASALAAGYVRDGRCPDALRLMLAEDAAVAAAAIRTIGPEVDLGPYRAALRPLQMHSDKGVRTAARSVLSREPGEEDVLALEARLHAADPDVRHEACFALNDRLGRGLDVTVAAPRLIEMLGGADAWHAVQVLRHATNSGLDLRPHVPLLLGLLDSGGMRGETVRLLGVAVDQGADVSSAYGRIATMIDTHETMYDVLRIFKAAAERGDDLSDAEAGLRAAFEHDNTYVRDQSGYVMAVWLLHQRRFDALADLLRHPRYGVRCGASRAIEGAPSACASVDGLMDALRANASHPNELVRIATSSALDALKPYRADVRAPDRVLQVGAPVAMPAPLLVARDGAIELHTRGETVRVFRLQPFSGTPRRALVDVYREVGAAGGRLVRNMVADALLASACPDPHAGGGCFDPLSLLEPYTPFLTDCLIAYEAPDVALGEEIVFAFEGCPTLAFPTGRHRGVSNVALTVMGVRAEDFVVEGGRVRIAVDDARVVPLRRFPSSTGWYLPDADTGIPCGWADAGAADARRLVRHAGAYVGPVGRGCKFSGVPQDDVRWVLAGTFAWLDASGILMER